MAEERLKAALERAQKDLGALEAGKEACGNRGAKVHYNRLIEKQEAVVDTLKYALSLTRVAGKEE